MTDLINKDVILSLLEDNFSAWDEQLKFRCIIKYGDAGEQIRTGLPNTLTPFAKPPTEDDTIIRHGREILRYPRVPADEEDDPNLPELARSLTGQARRELRDDIAIYNASVKVFTDHDVDLLSYTCSNISSASLVAIQADANYQTYLKAPAGFRSLLFYEAIKATHCIGNAGVKLRRTETLFTLPPVPVDQLEQFIPLFRSKMALFTADFEDADPKYKGKIDIGELASFLFLKTIDKEFYKSFLDQLLSTSVTGRFGDTEGLIAKVQNHKTMHYLSNPTLSTAAAYTAPVDPPATKSSRPCFNNDPRVPKCKTCLSFGRTIQSGRHRNADCFLNKDSTVHNEKLLKDLLAKRADPGHKNAAKSPTKGGSSKFKTFMTVCKATRNVDVREAAFRDLKNDIDGEFGDDLTHDHDD